MTNLGEGSITTLPAGSYVQLTTTWTILGKGLSTARNCTLLTSTWFGLRHRQNIRDFHPDFLVTANSWPLFLYANSKYNPNFPNHGLFKGELLIKVGSACLVAHNYSNDFAGIQVHLHLTVVY